VLTRLKELPSHQPARQNEPARDAENGKQSGS
jgi:hypothetical protein